MNAGIGASTALGKNVLTCDVMQHTGEFALHSSALGLYLPPRVRRAVIGDHGFEISSHISISTHREFHTVPSGVVECKRYIRAYVPTRSTMTSSKSVARNILEPQYSFHIQY